LNGASRCRSSHTLCVGGGGVHEAAAGTILAIKLSACAELMVAQRAQAA